MELPDDLADQEVVNVFFNAEMSNNGESGKNMRKLSFNTVK